MTTVSHSNAAQEDDTAFLKSNNIHAHNLERTVFSFTRQHKTNIMVNWIILFHSFLFISVINQLDGINLM